MVNLLRAGLLEVSGGESNVIRQGLIAGGICPKELHELIFQLLVDTVWDEVRTVVHPDGRYEHRFTNTWHFPAYWCSGPCFGRGQVMGSDIVTFVQKYVTTTGTRNLVVEDVHGSVCLMISLQAEVKDELSAFWSSPVPHTSFIPIDEFHKPMSQRCWNTDVSWAKLQSDSHYMVVQPTKNAVDLALSTFHPNIYAKIVVPMERIDIRQTVRQVLREPQLEYYFGLYKDRIWTDLAHYHNLFLCIRLFPSHHL